MSGGRILGAAFVTVAWVIGGLAIFGPAVIASNLGLALRGPFFDFIALFNVWMLAGAIIGVGDILIIWDELSGF